MCSWKKIDNIYASFCVIIYCVYNGLLSLVFGDFDIIMHGWQYNYILLTTFLFINVRSKHYFLFLCYKHAWQIFLPYQQLALTLKQCSFSRASWCLHWWCFTLKPMLPKKLMWSSNPWICSSLESCRIQTAHWWDIWNAHRFQRYNTLQLDLQLSLA